LKREFQNKRNKDSSKLSADKSGRTAKKQAVLHEIEENKYAVYGLLGVFLVLVFLAASFKITGDDDVFWHLATGRYIIENKVVPDTDVFGFVTAGEQWIPFEWGWDVLTFGLYNLGGYNAIMAFRSIAFVMIFALLFLLFRKFKINSVVSIFILFLLLMAVMDRLSPRPHIITYIFFVTLIYILVSYKYLEREKYSKRVYFIPLIFLIWGNCHMGVLAGGLFLFIFTISETIIYLKPRSFSSGDIKPFGKNDIRKIWIISIISALVLLVNPHGLQTYFYAYSHTKMKMLETVNEWENPFSADFGFTVTLYKVFLFSGLIVLFYAYSKRDLFFALLYIGLAIYSVRAIRFTVDYDFIMILFIAISLNYYLVRLRGASPRSLMNLLLYNNVPKVIISLFLVYVIIHVPDNSIYTDLKYYRVSGWGINDDFIPVQLFDFMKENNISGKPFNQFGTGGYLVWSFPAQKNFIDSRNLNDQIFNEYDAIMRMAPGFEKELDKYGVDYVIYLDPDLIRRPTSLKTTLPSYLCNSTEWKLVFWDDKSMLFLKNIPRFSEIISRFEYRILNPYTIIFNQSEFEKKMKENAQQSKIELQRKADTEPKGAIYKTMYNLAQRDIQFR